MGDLETIREVAATAEGVGVVKLVGEASCGMPDQARSEINQGARAAPVAELGLREMALGEIRDGRLGPRQEVTP